MYSDRVRKGNIAMPPKTIDLSAGSVKTNVSTMSASGNAEADLTVAEDSAATSKTSHSCLVQRSGKYCDISLNADEKQSIGSDSARSNIVYCEFGESERNETACANALQYPLSISQNILTRDRKISKSEST